MIDFSGFFFELPAGLSRGDGCVAMHGLFLWFVRSFFDTVGLSCTSSALHSHFACGKSGGGRGDAKRLITPYRFSLIEMSVCLTYLKPPTTLSNFGSGRKGNQSRDRQTDRSLKCVGVERSTLWWRASHAEKMNSKFLREHADERHHITRQAGQPQSNNHKATTTTTTHSLLASPPTILIVQHGLKPTYHHARDYY
jgi:hypothetical protein